MQKVTFLCTFVFITVPETQTLQKHVPLPQILSDKQLIKNQRTVFESDMDIYQYFLTSLLSDHGRSFLSLSKHTQLLGRIDVFIYLLITHNFIVVED